MYVFRSFAVKFRDVELCSFIQNPLNSVSSRWHRYYCYQRYSRCNALDRELVQPGCKIPPRSNHQFYQWWVAFYVISGHVTKYQHCVYDYHYYIIFVAVTNKWIHNATHKHNVSTSCVRGIRWWIRLRPWTSEIWQMSTRHLAINTDDLSAVCCTTLAKTWL